MEYRYLTLGEKFEALQKLHELDRLEHLLPSGAINLEIFERVKIVGAFDEDGEIAFVYWTYNPDAEAKRRFIAVGALRQLGREMLRQMRHVVSHLTREWELWGEVDADNPRGVKLAELCGFTVEAVLDSRIIVKHEREKVWEKAAEITMCRR